MRFPLYDLQHETVYCGRIGFIGCCSCCPYAGHCSTGSCHSRFCCAWGVEIWPTLFEHAEERYPNPTSNRDAFSVGFIFKRSRHSLDQWSLRNWGEDLVAVYRGRIFRRLQLRVQSFLGWGASRVERLRASKSVWAECLPE